MIPDDEQKAQMMANVQDELLHCFAEMTETPSVEEVERRVQVWKDKVGPRIAETALSWSRQPAQSASDAKCACGGHRQSGGLRPKQMATLQGTVTIYREYWYCRSCRKGEAPLDERLGIVGTQTSAGVQREVAWRAAHLTMEEAAADFTRAYPLAMSACQVETLIRPVGSQFKAEEEQRMQQTWGDLTPPAPATREAKRWYVEMDGVFARIRREDLELTEEEQNRPGDGYREIKVGVVAQAERSQRRSQLAPGVWVDTLKSPCYVAQRVTADQFGAYLYTLVMTAGYQEGDEVVILGDGAHWIWNIAAEHFPQATEIVDLYHAKEHLWKVARAAFPESSRSYLKWTQPLLRLLEQGQIDAVITAILALPPIPPAPGHARSVLEEEADYFRFHAARMQYPLFRSQGMMIGSGLAEAGCKTVVSSRCKRSGMRWTLSGLDALLAIRTSVLNASFDSWWLGRIQTLVA